MVQADESFRSSVDGMRFMYVRSKTGQNVPLDSLLKPRETTGASTISRFNGSRSISIQGNAGNGYSSGQAMTAIEEVVREIATDGYGIEWSGQAREEKKSSSSTTQVLALALG